MQATERHRQVAALHVAHLDQGFLATLGAGFVALMYRAIEEAHDSVLLVEERDGRIAGFVAGGLGMGPIYSAMLRHPFALAWNLAPSMLRPRRVLRVLEILRYSRDVRLDDTLPRAELLSIAVDPAHRGGDVAKRLYRGLVEHFRARGIGAFRITVGAPLLPAHRFYRRMGAIEAGTVSVHGDAVSTVYVQRVD